MIGFLDESSLRTDPSRRRVVNTPVIRYTDKGEKHAVRSMTIFGFMSLNGRDAVMASQSAKAFDMVSFLEVDILEVESAKEDTSRIEATLREMVEGLGARLIRINRYSPTALEAVVGCKCAVDNSSVAVIESAGCIPVMPVSYRGGLEYCRMLAFTKGGLDAALARLSKMSMLEIQSKSVVPRQSARGAITMPVDEFLGALTRKQLGAFMAAMQMGYYSLPKHATMEEIASSQGMKRSTYEEHLRKAELKILQAVRPYARLAYVTSEES